LAGVKNVLILNASPKIKENNLTHITPKTVAVLRSAKRPRGERLGSHIIKQKKPAVKRAKVGVRKKRNF